MRALRGVNATISATVVARGIGDITRFENPGQLRSWLGLHAGRHDLGFLRRGMEANLFTFWIAENRNAA
ncbi:transposase [uncultured Tateyamaria sp.]|uniref:transposase n=1 Tax=uncultured Tateyamaria sp. TaxID=455651 RepID=UPI00344E6243